MVIAGQLDKQVVFQSFTEASNDYNEAVATWSEAFTTFAQVLELKGREGYEGQQKQNRTDIRLKIRYRTDITTENRFIYNGQTYDIISIQELGRKDAMFVFGNIRVIT